MVNVDDRVESNYTVLKIRMVSPLDIQGLICPLRPSMLCLY